MRGLSVVAGLRSGVRQAAPCAAALLTLLYLASSAPTSHANVEATRQLEFALGNPLAALGGAGIVIYGLLWVSVPAGTDVGMPSPVERRKAAGLVILGIGASFAA